MEDYFEFPEEGANPHPVSEPDYFSCSWAYFEESQENKVVMYCKKNVYRELQLEEVISELREKSSYRTGSQCAGKDVKVSIAGSSGSVLGLWNSPGPSGNNMKSSKSTTDDVVPSSTSKLPFKVFSDDNENHPKDSKNEPVDLFCPMTIFEDQSFGKKAMYPKARVYREMQFEEIRAEIYLKAERTKQAVKPVVFVPDKQTEKVKPLLPELRQMKGDMHSVLNCQSFTAHTLEAMNVAQQAWFSPEKSKTPCDDRRKEELQPPNPPEPAQKPTKLPFSVFTEPSSKENVQRIEKKTNKFDVYCEGEEDKKNSVIFSENKDDEVCKEPGLPLSDETCTTAAFNFVLPSSTPVSKKLVKNKPQQASDANGSLTENKKPPPGNNQELSIILESSAEKLSSSGGVKPSRGEIDLAMKQLRIDERQINPFSGELTEFLLNKLKFPPQNLKNVHICQANLPSLTKKVKMGPSTYNIISEIGKGAYARVVKATSQPGSSPSALKVEKPPCLWELYICHEVAKRVPREKLHLFMEVRTAYIFHNGSVLDTEWARYGSLLQAVNTTKLALGKGLDSTVVTFFTIEMLDILDYLHRAKIIHGDVKPDNFVLRDLPTYKNPVPCVQLIDFGRSIDMTLFPEGTQFTTVVTTDGFQCNEMKEGRPWSYQTDFYGLAGTVHCLLVCDYMKVMKKKNVWTLQKPLLRSMREFWDPFFLELLNIKSSNDLPDLRELRQNLVAQYSSLIPCNVEQIFNNFRNIMNGH